MNASVCVVVINPGKMKVNVKETYEEELNRMTTSVVGFHTEASHQLF